MEEAIEKSLKDRDKDERGRQSRRKNIIVFGLSASKKTAPEDIKKFLGLCRSICKINFTQEYIERAKRLGKQIKEEKPLLIAPMEENKK